MNKTLREEFKTWLLALQAELEQRAEHNNDALGTVELDQNRVGRLSRIDALQGQQMAQETERRRLLKLQHIEGALRRLDQGDFGICYVCEDDIAPERLRFDPTLTRCVHCSEVS
jgi:DnaK suppressor protein